MFQHPGETLERIVFGFHAVVSEIHRAGEGDENNSRTNQSTLAKVRFETAQRPE